MTTKIKMVDTGEEIDIGYGPVDASGFSALAKGDLISFDGETYSVVDREWYRKLGETTYLWNLRLIVELFHGRGLVPA